MTKQSLTMPPTSTIEPHDPLGRPLKRTRRKEARPNEIVAAALAVFVDKGFAGARMDEIAKQAGVSKATLFVYFPSKDDLFKAVVRTNIIDRLTAFQSTVAHFQGSSGDLIALAMHKWWQEIGSTQAGGISKLIIQEAKNFPELAAFYQTEVMWPGLHLMQAILKRGIARGELRDLDLTNTVMGIMSSLLFLCLWRQAMGVDNPVCGPAIEPTAFIQNQIDILLSGIELKGNPPCV